MTIRERLENITNPIAQKKELFEILDELGIKYKETGCTKCINDYYRIAMEEAGMIESAAEESDFNTADTADRSEKKEKIIQYEYIYHRPVLWYRTPDHPIRMDDRTSPEIIKEFIKTHKGFYIEQATIPFEN